METLSRWALTYLLNAVWQVGVVAAAAAVADLLLRRAPSRYRHAVWFIALTVAALLPATSLTRQAASTGGARPDVVQSQGLRVAGHLAPLPRNEQQGVTHGDPSAVGARHGVPLRGAELAFYRQWPLRVDALLGQALLALYMAFILVRLARLARAWRKTSTLRASAFARELPEKVASILAGSRDADILFSSSITLPVTLGAVRPVILLPDRLVEKMDTDELATALLHEMAHVRRRDYLLNLVAEFLVLPLSFHPGAIFLKRRIDETRELACDDLAAGCLESRANYARALVSLARKLVGPLTASGYTLGVLDTDILEERIMSLFNHRTIASKPVVLSSVAAGIVLLAATGFAASIFSLAPNAQGASAQPPPSGGVTGGVVGGVVGGVSGGVAGEVKGEVTGSVSGVVTDASGARVLGAIVSLSAKERGFLQRMTTNQAGEYAFKGIPPGVYELEVESPGFQVQFFRRVEVGPDQGPVEYKGKPGLFAPNSPFIPVVLKVGTVAESVVVKAKAPRGMPARIQNPAPTRIRVGGSVEAAKLISSVPPGYPEEARAKGIEGTVVLDGVISVEGAPLSLVVISSPDPILSDAATKAVREWRYKPTLLNGVPVEVVTTITVRFELEH